MIQLDYIVIVYTYKQKDLWSKQGSHASEKCAHAHSYGPYDGGEDFRWVDKDDAETADDAGLTNQGQGSGQRFNIDGFRCLSRKCRTLDSLQ